MQAANEKARGKNGGDPISMQLSERALLAYVILRLHLLDADVIVGHNVGNWDLSILLQRMQLHKVLQWSRIGRFKRTRMPNIAGGGGTYGGGASHVRLRPALVPSRCSQRVFAFFIHPTARLPRRADARCQDVPSTAEPLTTPPPLFAEL